jgi:hypothetical protein
MVNKTLNKLLKLKYNFNPILHNRVILYFFFAIALFDLLYFLNNKDMFSFSALILIGILTSFFNKNMTVILFVAIIFTHILKYGRSSFEGLDNMDSKKEGIDGDEENVDDKKDTKKVDEKKKDMTIDEASKKVKSISNRITDLVNVNQDDDANKELIDSLPEMRETRDEIISKVKDMKPLLKKYEGFIDKFKSISNN